MSRKMLFFACWALINQSYAQPVSYSFARLHTGQGLSNNQVNRILKDSRGFLWIGTLSGLNRYDGYGFRTFRHSLRDSTSLPGNYITHLFEGPKGRIWIETRSGYAVYDLATERFYRNTTPYLQELGLPGVTIRTSVKDRQGNYWLLTSAGAYYYRTKTGRCEPVLHRPTDSSTPTTNDLTDLREDSRGQVWLVHRQGMLEKMDPTTHQVTYRTNLLQTANKQEPHTYKVFVDVDNDLWLHADDDGKGVFLLDTKTQKLTHIQKDNGAMSLNNNMVRAITQDQNGLIWIGTDHGGINLLDKKNGTMRYLLHNPTDESSVAQNSISDFYKDTDGTIWVGTQKQGISYYHKTNQPFSVYRHRIGDPTSLGHDDVNRFAEDARGNLWIGTNGGGLNYFDRSRNEFSSFPPYEKAAGPNSVIVSMLIDSKHTLWVGTYYGGLYAVVGNTVTTYRHDAANPASIGSNNIWALHEDRHHQLWIGTLGGGLDRFDRQQGRFQHYRHSDGHSIHSDFISSIIEDRTGDLWVGTASGIDVRDSHTGQFRQYANYMNDPNGLSNNNITSIFEDSQGVIWVGTQEGLDRFDKQTGQFHVLRQEDGLPDNSIFSIAEDDQHTLWLGTPSGLASLVTRCGQDGKETYLIRSYTESDGLPGRAFNENAVLKTRRGELVFGGASGFTLFRPDGFHDSRQRPQLVLTDLQIFNQSVRVGEVVEGSVPLTESITASRQLTFTHRQNVFSIEFAALNVLHADKMQYQYKLEGFNKDWLMADNRVRKATFTNLNPGNYTFRVRVASNHGQWYDDPNRLHIRVLPPFWQSPLAYGLYILFGVGLLMLARRIVLDRAHLTFQMQQARQQAQHLHEIDEMKIKFFTNISHEFRTPLTLIISPLEQLMQQAKKPAQLRQFQLIHRNARRLLNLVNQLLDFRKMAEQGLTLQPARQDIVAFCRDIVQSFSDLSEKKHIQCSFQTNVAELPLLFDHDKLERSLLNLLSNAFKFTPENGQVALTVNLLPPEDALQWLTIAVSDTGIGIATDEQEKIFDRFFQSDLPATLINQGSGIGLAITREFIHLHEGTLLVESVLGHGSTFTIRLPVHTGIASQPLREPIAEQPVVPKPPSASSPEKPTVLLVEDNDDFRSHLTDSLRPHYTILEAATGREAWQVLQTNVPSLVISDVEMPDMDGIELCCRIRADHRTAQLPMLLLSARSAEAQVLAGLEAGASDYLTKPVNMEMLLARIENLIRQQSRLQKIRITTTENDLAYPSTT